MAELLDHDPLHRRECNFLVGQMLGPHELAPEPRIRFFSATSSRP